PMRPSRCARLRASLRARRTASAFSRARFSEGFSKWPRIFISRKMPSRCIFFLSARSAWSTLLSRTSTCTWRSCCVVRYTIGHGHTAPPPRRGRRELGGLIAEAGWIVHWFSARPRAARSGFQPDEHHVGRRIVAGALDGPDLGHLLGAD